MARSSEATGDYRSPAPLAEPRRPLLCRVGFHAWQMQTVDIADELAPRTFLTHCARCSTKHPRAGENMHESPSTRRLLRLLFPLPFILILMSVMLFFMTGPVPFWLDTLLWCLCAMGAVLVGCVLSRFRRLACGWILT